MQTLKFTVKNPTLLKEFLGKFPKIDKSSALLYFSKDSLKIRTFTATKSYIKESVLKFSDVFNESEIDLEDTVFVYIYERLDKLISSISFFSNQFTFNIECKKIKDTKLLQNFEKLGIVPDECKYITVGDNIRLSSNKTNIDISCTSIEMAKTILVLTDEKFESIISSEDRQHIYSFDITKDDLSSITSLFGKLGNEDTEKSFKVFSKQIDDVENVAFASKSFEYFVPILKSTDGFSVDVTFPTDFFKFMDKETSTISLEQDSTQAEARYVLVLTSQETQTRSICIANAFVADEG